MTNPLNKEFNFLKHYFYADILELRRKVERKEFDYDKLSWFCLKTMDLLDEYYIKDIQYKARIKTLKELLKENNKRV